MPSNKPVLQVSVLSNEWSGLFLKNKFMTDNSPSHSFVYENNITNALEVRKNMMRTSINLRNRQKIKLNLQSYSFSNILVDLLGYTVSVEGNKSRPRESLKELPGDINFLRRPWECFLFSVVWELFWKNSHTLYKLIPFFYPWLLKKTSYTWKLKWKKL